MVDTALDDDLNYVIQSDLVDIGVGAGSSQVGINQYLIKTINDQLATAIRIEWWKNDGVSQYAMTSGVNIRPADNLIVRPEIRYDWQIPGGAPSEQYTFGIDAILTF